MPPEPGRHLHLDPLGGVAGDMLAAALLDLAPEFPLRALLDGLGAPEMLQVAAVPASDAGFAGRRLVIEGEAPPPPRHATELIALVAGSTLAEPVRERAVDMLRRLAEAEAAVHGLPLEKVHFHELASWDTLVDLSLAAGLVEHLGVASVSIGPLPLGGGTVASAHGALPIPAPATAQLLAGFSFHDDGVKGERVTPTGAAILAHLRPSPALPGPATLLGTGSGFGTRRLPGRANLLRALLFATTSLGADVVGRIRFEVDDQSGEDLALGLDRLRAATGVLDVVAWPVMGKKGRIATAVQVLSEAGALSGIVERCFAETTTIGLRHELIARTRLPRQAIEVDGRPVKEVLRPSGRRTRKVEAAALDGDAAARAALRRRLETVTDR